MEFATKTIHAGQPSEPETGSLIAPIFQTSTYEQDEPGVNRGFDYSRTNNPTRARLETVLAELEGVEILRDVRVGPRRRERDAPGVPEAGRRDRHPARRLRRHLPDPEQGLPAARLRDQADRSRDRGRARSGAVAEDEAGVDRVADQSAAARVRHRGDRRGDARRRRAARRRQHVRVAALPAAVRARRRPRRPQRDEVPRRPLRRDPGRGPRARGVGVRAGEVPAERDRRGSRAVRLLAHAARPQDARAADAAPRRQRGSDRQRARRPSAREARLLPRPPDSSRPRDRETADDRLRRHGVVRARTAPSRKWCRSCRRAGSSRSARASAASRRSSVTRPG